MAGIQNNTYIGRYRVFPIERIGDNSVQRVGDAKHSGKIILPWSVLRTVNKKGLTNLTLMIFKLINDELPNSKVVFCGVFSFDGEEKKVSVPLWILKQLAVEPGKYVLVELVTAPIPKGLFVKFQPLTRSFLQITDPKAVLEHCLRNYVCITHEDVISIYYNENIYELKVYETRPSNTIVINECDLTVDFQEMEKKEEIIELPKECDLDQIQAQNNSNSFEAFSGVGQSTGYGKSRTHIMTDQTNNNHTKNGKQKKGIPDYDYKMGIIYFKRHKSDLTTTNNNTEQQKMNQSSPLKKVEENKRVTIRRPLTRSQTQLQQQLQEQTQTQLIRSSPTAQQRQQLKNQQLKNQQSKTESNSNDSLSSKRKKKKKKKNKKDDKI